MHRHSRTHRNGQASQVRHLKWKICKRFFRPLRISRMMVKIVNFSSFHAHTLTLYAALCYQSNYRAAHALCQHVDQKQLLYAIRAEYMSGPLRQGFYDLLIALHLESHATTMEVCKNEYIIPLGRNFHFSEPSKKSCGKTRRDYWDILTLISIIFLFNFLYRLPLRCEYV